MKSASGGQIVSGSKQDARRLAAHRKRAANEKREAEIRSHVADLVVTRLDELKAQGRPKSYEGLAQEMGEFGKDAVLRIVSKERSLQPALLERLAAALETDVVRFLEPILGAEQTRDAVERRLNVELTAMLRVVTVLGNGVVSDRHSVDALRALGAIDDRAERKKIADVVLAFARDYERMSGARRLLVGPPGRQPQGTGGPKKR